MTVKDVSVLSVNPQPTPQGSKGFTFSCEWVVTARVKHWQHVHNRQGTYVGDITIHVEDERWKILHLKLKSEQRKVLARKT